MIALLRLPRARTAVGLALLALALALAPGLAAQERPSVSGIHPHLAAFNDVARFRGLFLCLRRRQRRSECC